MTTPLAAQTRLPLGGGRGWCMMPRHEAWGHADSLTALGRLTAAQQAEIDAVIDARPDCGWRGPLAADGRGCGDGRCWCLYTALDDECALPLGHAGPHAFRPVSGPERAAGAG